MRTFGLVSIAIIVFLAILLVRYLWLITHRFTVEKTGHKKVRESFDCVANICFVWLYGIADRGMTMRYAEKDEDYISIEAMLGPSVESVLSITGSVAMIRQLQAKIDETLAREHLTKILVKRP